jgi:hypothetical protein
MSTVTGTGMGTGASTVATVSGFTRFKQGWQSAAVAVVVGLALLFGLPSVMDDFMLIQVTIYLVMSILAISLGFIWGFGGILCFGQAAFFGLGSYVYAVAVINMGDSTVPFLLAIAVPALFAALLGYVIFYGRLSDVYMGVITLTVTLILFNLINSTAGPEWTIGTAALGGFNGMPAIPPLNAPGNAEEIITPTACAGSSPRRSAASSSRAGRTRTGYSCSATTRAPTSCSPSCSAARSRGWPAACSPTGAPSPARPSSASRSRRRSSSG